MKLTAGLKPRPSKAADRKIGLRRAPGRSFSGRSMLRPYGILLRQYARELIMERKSKESALREMRLG